MSEPKDLTQNTEFMQKVEELLQNASLAIDSEGNQSVIVECDNSFYTVQVLEGATIEERIRAINLLAEA